MYIWFVRHILDKGIQLAIDNSLYDSLENTYFKIKEYLENNKLGSEHSPMIIKHEELAELLAELDIEAIEEQRKDINALHEELNDIKEDSNQIVKELNNNLDSTIIVTNVVDRLDKIFSKISNVIV